MDAAHGVAGIPGWTDAALVLGLTALVGPVARRVRVSPVFGFLAAGAVVGPYGLGATDNVEGVHLLAELGVVFLLFTIGLELSFERLKAMRRLVFGLGAAQVTATAVVIGAIAYMWGNSVGAAMIVGLSLALSSTAIVIQLLIERGEMAQRFGRTGFAILLFQDLAVVPILMLVSVLASDSTDSVVFELLFSIGKAVVAVAVIIVIGRLILRPLYKAVAEARSREALLATSLLVVLATAWATAEAGLSMALGAFLAGLLLAETEYRHQVESDIEPFKGLLLGLFFISVGMNLNFVQVADWAFWLVFSVIGLVIVKGAVAIGLCRLFGQPWDVSLRTGLLLATGGEFAFVILGVAATPGSVLPTEVGQFMIIVATLSMVLTPLLAAVGPRIAKFFEARSTETPPLAEPRDDLEGHVIIAGFGRVGQTAARLFDREKIPFLALDLNVGRIGLFRRSGMPVFYGDATRTDVLARVHPERASAILLTLDDPNAAARALHSIRGAWPDIPVIARAIDNAHAEELRGLGADAVVPETLEASLQLSGFVLRMTGMGRDAVDGLIEGIRSDAYAPIAPLPASDTAQGGAAMPAGAPARGPTEPPGPLTNDDHST